MRELVASLGVAILLAAVNAFAAWDGSYVTPKLVTQGDSTFYEISTPEEFAGFLKMLPEASTHPVKAALKNDIVFGKDTSSISELKLNRFTDNIADDVYFSGNNKTIYGVNSDRSLFAFVGVRGGFILDLTLANSQIGSDTTSDVGGLLYNCLGYINNVEVRNTVIKASKNAGGIAVKNDYNNSFVSRMLNVRSVKNKIYANIAAGGVVESASMGLANAYNSSDIFVLDSTYDSEGSIFIAGGVVGLYYPAPNSSEELGVNLVNEGNIYAVSAMPIIAGGITALAQGRIVHSFNYGDVYARSTGSYAYVGGIAAKAPDGDDVDEKSNPWKFSREQLVNEGKVYGEAVDSVFAGGIYGMSLHMAARDVANLGQVKAVGTGETSRAYVGGITGLAMYYAYDYCGYRRLANIGNVDAHSQYNVHVGGIFGMLSAQRASHNVPDIDESFNAGDITGICDSDTSTMANVEVGGIVGFNEGGLIRNVYNRGQVVGEAPVADWNYAGGLVGKQYLYSSVLHNSYSASSKIKATHVGGLVAYFRYAGDALNVYMDGDILDAEVLGDSLIAYSEVEGTAPDSLKKSTTAFMQSDAFMDLLNNGEGTFEERKLWSRKDGYPVFDFDTLVVADDPEEPLGIAMGKIPQAGFAVSVRGLEISVVGNVAAYQNSLVSVYTLQGKLVARGSLDGGLARLKVPAPSAYLVRVGSQARKVYVK